MKHTYNILTLVMALNVFAGCMACSKEKMYKIDFSGQEASYCQETTKENNRTTLRTEYRAGEQVVLYFFMVATDTNYNFLLDGEPLNPQYAHDKGYIISFTMPEHDVRLECQWYNSMMCETPDTSHTKQY